MEEKRVNFPAGQIVFAEGDTGESMYIVIRGLVQVYRDTPSGRVVLKKLGPGGFFGEMALIGKTPRTATVVALIDSTLAVYKTDELESLLETKPGVGARMIRDLVDRLRETTNMLTKERGKRSNSW